MAPGSPALRVGGELERRAGKARDAQDRDVVLRSVEDRRHVERRAVVCDDAGVGLPGHHVRVRDDLLGAGDPTGAGEVEAAGGAEHVHGARRGRTQLRAAQRLAIGRRHVRRRAAQRRGRVDPVEDVEDRPRRRHGVVEGAEDLRALDVGPVTVQAGRVEDDGPDHPAHGEDEPGDRDRAPDGIDRPRGPATGEPVAQGHAEALEHDGEDAADEQAAEQRRRRRIGRLRATAQQQRSDPAADEGAHGEAGERGRRDDQPLPEAERDEQQDGSDDHPVDRGHGLPTLRGRVSTCTRRSSLLK